MARPDDVVLYDLDEHADADSLLSMVKDPEQRWFARARLASLAARGLLANGVWDPKLHPRGRDGRFIRKFGWVRWLANGRWLSGQVRSIDPDTGNITVQRLVPKDGGYVTVDTVFTPSGIKGQLYVAPPPKGSLNLPDPKIGKNAPGFEKVGGQGGSNPGGLYQLADVGGPGRLSKELIDQLKNDFGLVEIPSSALTDDEGPAIGLSPEGRVVLSRGLGKQTIDYLGAATDDSDITTWLQAPDDPHKTEAAWGHATALADLLNDGQKVYVKHAKSELHARNEVLANRLYELAGVNVAETIMGTDGVTIGSKLVPEMASKVKIGEALDDEEAMARMRRDFVVDAWLANWDVIGLGLENTQVVDGHPYRIDAGGALLYRAQGAPKGGAFGPSVGEIDTLRDASVNPAAAKVFGKVTEDEMLDGAQRVAAISPEMIKAQVEAAEMPDSLADTLIARRADIIARFHLEDPYWGAPPEPKPVVEPAEGTKAPDVPEPVTAPPSIAKSLVWSTDDQTWVESDANVSDGLPQLKTKLEGYYDDSNVWSASTIEALYLDHPESTAPVFALLGGSLHEIKSISVSDDGGYYEVKAAAEGGSGLEKTYFFNSGDTLRVAKADTDLAKANLSAIMANEKVVREWSITQLADLSLPGLFAEGEANAENPVFGTFIPMTPRFTAHFTQAYPSADGSLKFTSLSPPGDPDFQPKMVWFPDSESDGHLFQVLPGTADEGYTLMNPITGKLATPDEVESVSGKAGYAVSANDPYSLEVLEAYIQRAKATTPVEDPDIEAPTPIDPEVIEALDEKAEVTSVPEVTPAPPDYKSPPAGSKVSWYDGYYAIMAAAEEAAAQDSEFSKFDVLAEYIEAFGTASTADVSYDELDAFIAEQFPSLKQGVDTWLMEHSPYLSEPGDLVVDPDPTPTIPPPPTLPSQVDGVSPHLQVSESFQFTELPEDERVAKAQSLVGKVVFLTLTDVPDLDEDGAIEYGKLTGHTPPAALVYVEEVEVGPTATRIWVRLPSGEKKSTQVHGYNPTTAHFRVVENLDALSFKTAASPVAKADGTIVYAGQVVGKWSLNDQYYWSKHYTYTLFAEHTIFGKTIKGKLHKKSGIKNFASAMLVPKAPPTKSKKASPASKKIADKVAELPTLQGAKLSDGTEAKIGDWVKSIKGGGGFVGKIIGWPDQKNHPGLVFVVDTEGKQKAVKLKSQKKVPAPSDSADALIAQMPTAYAGMKLASGETPMVGQIVEAGKPGTTQAKGVVVNINPTQGYIYILTPEGKTVVKKSGVTTLISQPDLYWDSSNAGVAGVLTTTKAKKSSKKVPGFTYPGPDGAVIEQSQAEKDAWLNDHPKRKLTKDGFVPKVGMRVRNKAGDELIVLSVASSWDSNPNRVTTWNLTQNKQTSTSTTTIEVDHAAELTGYDGNLIKKVNSVSLLNPDTAIGPQVFPDGSVVYRYSIQHSWYDFKTGKTRTHEDFEFLVITPTGALYRVNNSYGGSHFSEYIPEHLKWLLKNQQPESFEKVAVVDSSAKGSLSLQPWKASGWGSTKTITNSKMEFNDVDTPTPTPTPTPDAPDVPEPEPTSVTPETPGTPGTTPEPEVPGTPGVPDTPETPETPETPSAADEDYEAVGEPTPVSSPPAVPSGSLTVLPAPPNPNPVEKAKKADPDLPQVIGSTDLSEVHPLVKKTKSAKSMREAAEQMIAQKDSTEPGSGVVYSMGDSDYIEDMAVRYNIETRPDGSEHLVMRFRLREEVSEDVMAKFVTSGEGKTGAWKLKDTKYAKELTVGDQIAVYLSSTTKLLKPENDGHPMDEPNAIVVEPPVLIGKSPANPDRDLYRVKIQTRDGEYGEVDMEQRPGGSIKTFEYDHDAPAKATGSNLHLTATAQQAGWVRIGPMSIPGQMHQDHTDSAGKVKWAGSITGLAPGTGGHRLQRTRPDGVRIDFQSAHSTEGGTGFGTTRRASISGEVRISVPLEDGKPTDVIVSQLSEAMQEVGVPPDKQTAPTDQELAMFALNKLVANYHPKYDYRAKPVKSADDPRVTEALNFMSKHLQKHLGRNVTLDDIRLHSFPNGRVAAVFSPEVAKAISKSQGSHHYHHSGVRGIGAAYSIDRVLAGAVNGLLSTDERWSLGVMTTGQSSLTDMSNGAGDRVYMRTVAGTNYKTDHVILSPLMVNSSLELYTMSVNDSWGKRTAENRTMNSHSGGHEFNFKRRMEPEQIAFYIVNDPKPYIEAVKKRGVTHIGGRPIEQIIVTPQQAKSIDIEDLGIEQFADDIPITEIPGITAPAAEGDAAAAPAAPAGAPA